MSEQERERMTVELLLLLIEQLSPAEQEELRGALNDKSWRNRMRQFVPDDLSKVPQDFSEKSSKAFKHLIERLESGDIDEDIAEAGGKFWQFVSGRLKVLSGAEDEREPSKPLGSGLEIELELAYEELQAKILPIRQALAQAIAAERHLEKLIDKNKMQRDSYLNQAAIAQERGNSQSSLQATQKAERYGKAVITLAEELRQQCERTLSYRQRLNELEGSIDDAHSRKEILIARQRAERAASVTDELISQAKTEDLLSMIARLEQEYADFQKQQQAALDAPTEASEVGAKAPQSDQLLLIRILNVLEKANTLMEKLDHKLVNADVGEREERKGPDGE